MSASTRIESRDSDFFAELLVALDRDLGFEPWDEAQAQQLFDAAEPVPLASDSSDEVTRRVRLDPPPRGRRPKHRRLLLPLSALVLAAATVSYCRWQGTHSTKTLVYEHAFQVLFDQSHTANQRISAHAVIYQGMTNYLEALRATMTESSPLGTEARLALDRATLLVAGQAAPQSIPQVPGRRSQVELIARLTDPFLTTAERQAALRDAIPLFEAGLLALREALATDPALEMDVSIALLKLVETAAGRPPNNVQWPPK